MITRPYIFIYQSGTYASAAVYVYKRHCMYWQDIFSKLIFSKIIFESEYNFKIPRVKIPGSEYLLEAFKSC